MPTERTPARWSPEAELEAYEALRRYDEVTFRRFATQLQPLLRRLARLSTDDEEAVRAAMVETWRGTLHSLGMFTWHTAFTTWVVGHVVGRGHLHGVAPAPAAAGAAPAGAVGHAAGDRDAWDDLPFGARWDGALVPLEAALVPLPRAVRVTLHLEHVERWSVEDGCDATGMTEAAYRATLDAGHRALHDVLAQHAGGPTAEGPLTPARVPHIGAALRLLHGPTTEEDEQLDRAVLLEFRAWAAETAPFLRRMLGRIGR